MTEKKQSFPMLPGAHWWALRDKFKQSIPGVVTDSYLAATLNMQPKSARANVLPFLEDLGLIDKDGKTQELARAWRDDDQYADVCKKMREHVYPEDLLSAAPDPSQDKTPADRWFANHTGVGASAVRRMVQLYTILAEADVSKRKQDAPPKEKPRKKATASQKTQRPGAAPVTQPAIQPSAPPQGSTHTTEQPQSPTFPGVCINLQIHISSDATPDQIDKIFESMAKHIYRK
ncbi:MAG: DUF5343 domain-containing protein [Phycisphaerae bacterium]|nr:DUF5343 domain-containing protein [Phycisphaerae bacterium]